MSLPAPPSSVLDLSKWPPSEQYSDCTENRMCIFQRGFDQRITAWTDQPQIHMSLLHSHSSVSGLCINIHLKLWRQFSLITFGQIKHCSNYSAEQTVSGCFKGAEANDRNLWAGGQCVCTFIKNKLSPKYRRIYFRSLSAGHLYNNLRTGCRWFLLWGTADNVFSSQCSQRKSAEQISRSTVTWHLNQSLNRYLRVNKDEWTGKNKAT